MHLINSHLHIDYFFLETKKIAVCERYPILNTLFLDYIIIQYFINIDYIIGVQSEICQLENPADGRFAF